MLLAYIFILVSCISIIGAGIIHVPLVECPRNVANVDVIEFIWKLVILDLSKGKAEKDDMERLFAFMDISGEKVPLVNFEEFREVFECTTMHFSDLEYVYGMIESEDGHKGISLRDVDLFWKEHINPDDRARVSKDNFIDAWLKIFKHAPRCGLIDPNQTGLLYVKQLCNYLIGDGF